MEKSFRHWLRAAVFAVGACGALPSVCAEPLVLPANLVGLATPAGEAMLAESRAREAYWPLLLQFTTQKSQSFCGVATAVMVLNALGVAAPPAPGFERLDSFTQDNLLDDATEAVLPQAVLLRQGMTLDEFTAILRSKGVAAEARHAADSSLDAFRAEAVAILRTPRQHVVVNYLRRVLGQERGGHISPLAAYDAATDRFLILDVSRYKYPPVWVSAADLFAAMSTPDAANGGKTRGFVRIG